MANPPRDDEEANEVHALYEYALRTVPRREEVDVEELKLRFDQAHSLYVQGGAGSRRGMLSAVNSVIAYLQNELGLLPGETDRLLLPLHRLSLALEDLEIGLIHEPLKAPVKRSGGTKLTRDQAEFRFLVCLAVRVLVNTGTSPLKAREYIAKRLSKAKFHQQRLDRDTGQPALIDEKTIVGWLRQRETFWKLITAGRRMSFKEWFYIRAHMPMPEDVETSGDAPLPKVVDLLFKVLLIEFGHLRAE